MMEALKRFIRRWIYRDSATGRFLSKEEFDRRDPATTQKEKYDA